MGYDSKGILVFNLKYEHAISFINLVKFINYYQMPRSISSRLVVRGGYGFLFRSENLFRTKQELEIYYFCRAKREILFQNLTLEYMTKILNQFFFSSTKIRIFFSASLGIRIFFQLFSASSSFVFFNLFCIFSAVYVFVWV